MDFIIDSAFSGAFSHNPTTFSTDPRVVGSVTGSAPVEHLHKGGCMAWFSKDYILQLDRLKQLESVSCYIDRKPVCLVILVTAILYLELKL